MKLNEARHLLTYGCNLRCRHCYLSAGEQSVETVPFSQKEADDFYGYFQPAVVSATGGEPLLEYELVKLLAKSTAKYGGSLELVTNGTLLSEGKVKTLNKLNEKTFYQISLDGNEVYHDTLRGRKGAYESALKAIDLCSSSGRTTKARMTVEKGNFYQVPEVINALDSLGRGNIRLVMRPVVVFGRAARNNLSFGEAPFESLESFRDLAQNIEVETTDNKGKCGCGQDTIAIDPKGDIYPCTYFVFRPEYRMGSFFGDFKEMAEHEEFVNAEGGCYARKRIV